MPAKSTLTRLEHKLLFVATAVVPIVAVTLLFALYFWRVYEYFYPPSIVFSSHGVTDFDLAKFRLVLTLTFAVSSILVYFKRISTSICLYAVPIGYLVYFLIVSHLRLAWLLEHASHSQYSDSFLNRGLLGIFMLTLTGTDLFLFCVMLLLVGWHIRILMRGYRRQRISLL